MWKIKKFWASNCSEQIWKQRRVRSWGKWVWRCDSCTIGIEKKTVLEPKLYRSKIKKILSREKFFGIAVEKSVLIAKISEIKKIAPHFGKNDVKKDMLK